MKGDDLDEANDLERHLVGELRALQQLAFGEARTEAREVAGEEPSRLAPAQQPTATMPHRPSSFPAAVLDDFVREEPSTIAAPAPAAAEQPAAPGLAEAPYEAEGLPPEEPAKAAEVWGSMPPAAARRDVPRWAAAVALALLLCTGLAWQCLRQMNGTAAAPETHSSRRGALRLAGGPQVLPASPPSAIFSRVLSRAQAVRPSAESPRYAGQRRKLSAASAYAPATGARTALPHGAPAPPVSSSALKPWLTARLGQASPASSGRPPDAIHAGDTYNASNSKPANANNGRGGRGQPAIVTGGVVREPPATTAAPVHGPAGPGGIASRAARLSRQTDAVAPEPAMEEPMPVRAPRYPYPAAARGTGIKTKVKVAVLVDEHGRPARAFIRRVPASGLGYGFTQIALDAALKTRFHPARRGRTPVKVWTDLTFEFEELPARSGHG